MSDLKTLKAQHLAIEASLDAVAIKRAGPTAAAIADLVTLAERLESKLQQHEATIAELNTSLAAAREVGVQALQHEQALRSDLVAAQDTIQQQARELEEIEAEIAYCSSIFTNYGLCMAAIPAQHIRAKALARHSARAQKAEVKKEDYVRLNCGHLGPAVLEGIANTFNKNSGGLYVRGCPSCSEQAEAKKEE